MVNEDILKEAAERIVSRFHPQRIILFGFQARQSADERSDVDFLIICPLKGNRRKLMVAMDRVLRGLPIARDIIILTPEEYERDKGIPGTVARPASREGRVLYEAA
ncbi:MAG: nucleotidyltransferase domain-containing protein [Nitrospirota bacterium]